MRNCYTARGPSSQKKKKMLLVCGRVSTVEGVGLQRDLFSLFTLLYPDQGEGVLQINVHCQQLKIPEMEHLSTFMSAKSK